MSLPTLEPMWGTDDVDARPMDIDGDETKAPPTAKAPATPARTVKTEAAAATAPVSATKIAWKPTPAAASSARPPSLSSAARERERQLAKYEVVDLIDEDSGEEGEEGGGRAGAEEQDEDRRAREESDRLRARRGFPAVERFTIDLAKLDRANRAISGRALRREQYPQFYPATPPPELAAATPSATATAAEESKSADAASSAGGSSSAAAAAAGSAPAGKKPRKKRARASALDYYDCTDSFIDDSELLDDFDEDAAVPTAASAAAAVSGPSKDGKHLVRDTPLPPEKLRELLSHFAVKSAAALIDEAEEEAAEAARAAANSSSNAPSSGAAAAASGGTGSGTAKKSKAAKQQTLEKAAADAAASRKKSVRRIELRKVERIPGTDEASYAAAQVTESFTEQLVIAAAVRTAKYKCQKCMVPHGATGTECKKCGTPRTAASFLRAASHIWSARERKREAEANPDAATTGAAAATGGTASKKARIVIDVDGAGAGSGATPRPGLHDSSRPVTPLAAVAPTPALPPPGIGNLHKEWLSCFDHFPATPAIVSLLEEIIEQARIYAASQSGPATQAHPHPPPQPQPPAAASTDAAAAEGGESKMTDVPSAESNDPDATQAHSQPEGSAAAAAAPASAVAPTRTGLRQKERVSLVAATRQHKLPEVMQKLLTRLGRLIELQKSDEDEPSSPTDPAAAAASSADAAPAFPSKLINKDATVNKFSNMLARESLFRAQPMRTRILLGRLEGELAHLLSQRFKLYLKLRDAVAADMAASPDSTSYAPDWPRYIRLLLDFTTYTDDLTEACEEIEAFTTTKKGGGGAAAAAATPNTSSADSAEAQAKLNASRIAMLSREWEQLAIPADLYPASHRSLLLSITDNLYAHLRLLWTPVAAEGEAGTAAPLVSESEIESKIEEEETRAQIEAERERERKEEAEIAEAARQAAELKKRQDAEEAAAKAEAERREKAAQAEAERKAAEKAAEKERLRKERKRAAKAAAAVAAAAAAAAALAAGGTPLAAAAGGPSLTGAAPTDESKEGASAAAAAAGASADKPKVVRHRRELRGEGDARQKQCFGPLCARANPSEGCVWKLLKDFPADSRGLGGVASRCRPCESLVAKEKRQAKAMMAGPMATAAVAGSAAAPAATAAAPTPAIASAPVSSATAVPSAPRLPPCSSVYAALPPPDQRWRIPEPRFDATRTAHTPAPARKSASHAHGPASATASVTSAPNSATKMES